MFRNLSQNPYSSFQSYQGRQSLSKTGTNFNNSRSPLYPIGPSLTQQEFHPIKRAPSPSPYLSRQGVMPPSYEQKYIRTSNQDIKRQMKSYNYEQRQREIINRNQNQIQQEQKRRDALRNSYERQIQSVNKNLLRNMDRKQKLLSQIQTLQQNQTQLHEQLSSMKPPKIQITTFQPLDRKQQELIIMKNKLLTSIRQKEDDFRKEQQEQERYWQNQIQQKQKILLKNQEVLKNKRIQLHSMKINFQKPDFLAIEDEVREQKYQDFMYQAQIFQDKINQVIQERQKQQRQVFECLNSKKNVNHSILLKHNDLTRQCTTSRIRAQQLQRVSKQMQVANDNLMKQLQRKQKMIQKYELDIHSLKQRTLQQQSNLKKLMNEARQKEKSQMQKNITQEMLKVQQDIRYQTSITNKLKNQYQKLYQILCSTASKNIHQTFNATLVV